MNNWKDYAKIAAVLVVAIVAGLAAYQAFAQPMIASYNAGKAGAATA